MTIGAKIKQRRQELKWSQRDLAEKMGYSHHSTVARIEADKVDVPQSRIVKFSEVLGVSIDYLMNWKQEPEELADITAQILLNPSTLSMVEQYLKLSDADQYAVRLMVASLGDKEKKTDPEVSLTSEKVSLLETE